MQNYWKKFNLRKFLILDEFQKIYRFLPYWNCIRNFRKLEFFMQNYWKFFNLQKFLIFLENFDNFAVGLRFFKVIPKFWNFQNLLSIFLKFSIFLIKKFQIFYINARIFRNEKNLEIFIFFMLLRMKFWKKSKI